MFQWEQRYEVQLRSPLWSNRRLFMLGQGHGGDGANTPVFENEVHYVSNRVTEYANIRHYKGIVVVPQEAKQALSFNTVH